jgi:type IV secretory pathway VirB10-like protein
MSGTEGVAAPVPPKQDPETLVLRGRPRPVIRFRRGLIIGVTGVMTAALVGLAWFALEPPSFRLAGEDPRPGQMPKVTAEGLGEVPATYADVPRLGPPLPGDLGRPILERQRALDGADTATTAEADRQAMAEQRLADQADSARTSAVLVPLAAGTAPSRSAAISVPEPAGLVEVPAGLAASAGQQRKLEFTRSAEGDLNPHGLVGLPSPWTLSAGTMIPASLLTGLNSDLPGIVLAQVTEPVRDSATGAIVLIPQGARLIGRYDSMVAFGQSRALVVWQRILFPDGSSVRLDNVPAADAAGFAGLEDRVEVHEGRLLKGIALSSLLGVGTELGLSGDERELVRALRESAQTNGARAGEAIVARNLEVQPTLTVRPGWPVRAVLHKDLILKPWEA